MQSIVSDAVAANAEGDTAGAYYHLRTVIEWVMKMTLEVPMNQKIDRSALCERYNSQLSSHLRSLFPSLGAMYAELSEGLHARSVNADRLLELMTASLDHLRAKALIEKYSNRGLQ